MCNSQASSTIASQQVKWGNLDDRVYLGQDWTKNSQVWNRFKEQLLQLPGLNNIHFMGGETLLTNRFEDLVDTMIEAQRFDLGFSFVTNGTVFQPDLIEKLKRFRQVGMEISIETTGPHNAYQRQGTDTQLVLGNIKKYQQHANGSTITVSVRPAPSILTIGYHTELLEYCLQNKLIVKSNLCYDPEFLDPRILPADIKMLYLEKYQQFLQQLDNTTITNDSNFSDPNNYQGIAKLQAEMCMALLKTKTPNNSEHLLEQMVRHCERWDRLYNLDARSLYPEWQDIFKRYDYKV
jgi:sulfatase maturation enzyme AslB (radical SAM superfamily)